MLQVGRDWDGLNVKPSEPTSLVVKAGLRLHIESLRAMSKRSFVRKV
jgi:hypothetical protein